MTKHWRKFLLAAFIACIAGSTWAAAAGPVNLHAAAIDDFNKRVKDYVDLHKKAESGLPGTARMRTKLMTVMSRTSGTISRTRRTT